MNRGTNRSKGEQRGEKKQRALILTLCVLLVIAIALLVIFIVIPVLGGGGTDAPSFFDERAQSGSLPGRTQEEIQAELDKIVAEGMFNISIASVVTVKGGDTEALVRIENIAANHHNMTVSITLEGEDKPIYESAGLAPGQYIEYAKLNRALPAGESNAIALFTAYDTGDLSKVGQAAAKITIVVGS